MSKQNLILSAVAAVVLVVGIGGYYVWQWERDRAVDVVVTERIDRPDLSFSFGYPSGNEALGMMQSAPDTLSDPDILQAFLLADPAAIQDPSTGMADGNITVLVFNWSDQISSSTSGQSSREKLETWAREYSGYSTFAEATVITPVDIDGAPAITFKSSGDLQREVYVARYDNKVYLFVSQYAEAGGQIDLAFDTVIESVVFE